MTNNDVTAMNLLVEDKGPENLPTYGPMGMTDKPDPIIPEIPERDKEQNYINTKFYEKLKAKLIELDNVLEKRTPKQVKLAFGPTGIYEPLGSEGKTAVYILRSRMFDKVDYTLQAATHVASNPELTMLFLNDIVDQLVSEFIEVVIFEEGNTVRFGGIMPLRAIEQDTFQPKIRFKIRYDITKEAI